MRKRWIQLLGLGLGICLCGLAQAGSRGGAGWTFENVPLGALPDGWRVGATNARGSLPLWEVRTDSSAPSGRRVLTMVRPAGAGGLFGFLGSTFNLCWTGHPAFRDGEIRVSFKALAGSEDQGGGIMWRVQDADNYDVVRFNPLEDNFRAYYVKEGHRRMIATARVTLAKEKWHRMRVIQHGDRFTAWLDGRQWLEGRNRVFSEAGGVGLWTKADAVTSFDDFSVRTD